MRRKIELYIDGQRADLDEQGFILYNYAVTDLEKPSAVRNSFSKQVKLPGTAANDAIFGGSFRSDREVRTTGFNPLVRTPFKIYSEAGEVLQSGYLKLDRVDRTATSHSYTVTLYGGLGSLIYGLMYGDDGEKLSLADLTYPVADASFYATINKDTIAAAWERLYSGSGSALWDIINFAPCYNGIPDKFDSNKARRQGQYSTVLELARKFNEWETRDLRSYLQRPAMRVKAVIDAIVTAAAAKGKTVTLDPAFFNANNPYYSKTWMLLPLLTNYEDSQAGQIGEKSSVVEGYNSYAIAEIPNGGVVKVTGTTFSSDANGKIDFSSFDPSFFLKGDVYAGLRFEDQNSRRWIGYLNYWSNNAWHGTLVGVRVYVQIGNNTYSSAKPYIFGNWNGSNDPRLLELLAEMGITDDYIARGNYFGDSTSVYAEIPNAPVAGSNAVYIRTEIFAVSDDAQPGETDFRLYASESSGANYFTGEINLYTTGGMFSLNTPGTIGSNITVTKDMLLSDTCTPADFLLSYCRQFGLRIVETAPDNISILALGTFHNGSTEDLSGGIDRKQSKLVPLTFGKKWQRLGLDIVQSTKAIEYKKQYGKEYGNISLDTGLEFNAETENLMAGSVFKGGISGKWSGRALFDFYDEDAGWVNPALAFGYTEGDTKIYPSIQSTTPLNSNHPGYDMTPKPFGFTEDRNEQKGVELSGMLVFLNGIVRNPGMWWLTDDYPDLSKSPCWQMPMYADSYSTKVVNFPVFARYYETTQGEVALSLDFATPEEIFDPDVELTPAASIYTRFWAAYLTDLYDKSNKVLTAKVHFFGQKVSADLFRKFFWYEGAIWVLNKITNHSLTTWDPVECEFVQVHDTTNYTNGQIL